MKNTYLTAMLIAVGIMFCVTQTSIAQKKSKQATITKETKPEKLCDPFAFNKCSLPFGTWGMTASTLLEALKNEKAVEGSPEITLDTSHMYSRMKSAFPNKPESYFDTFRDSISTKVEFEDSYYQYVYTFRKGGSTLSIVMLVTSAKSASGATLIFSELSKTVWLGTDKKEESSDTDKDKYSSDCGNSKVFVSVSRGKHDLTTVYLTYMKLDL